MRILNVLNVFPVFIHHLQPISSALQQPGARTATFRPQIENDKHSPMMCTDIERGVLPISAAREEHRLSLGDIPDVVTTPDVMDESTHSGGSSGSETDDSSRAETVISYMSDNQYDMEDMDMSEHANAMRRPYARPQLKLDPLSGHLLHQSPVVAPMTVVSPVKLKGIWNTWRSEYPETTDNVQYPFQIVVNDEHGSKMYH